MEPAELIKILIIDDDEDDFIITSSYLREIPFANFQIDWCSKHEEALQLICRKEYDLYFIDYFLGSITGMDLLRYAISCNENSPLILLTGKGNRDISLAALEAGAFDYLVKSELNTEKLERCIRYSLDKSNAMKNLIENEKKFRTIFERTTDAIFIANEEFCFLDVNPAMEYLSGYSGAELRTMYFNDFLTEEAPLDYIKQQLMHKHEVSSLEIGIQHISGEWQTCIFSAVAVFKPDNSMYIQGVLHDITQLKKAERSLLLSEKIAVTGRLARTLAHEIRNPLTNINLSIDHLKGMEFSEGQFHYFDIIGRNSKRINDILTELLASSKPTDTEKQVHVLQEILDKSIHAAMDRIMLKHIQLDVQYTDQPIRILADSEKLSIAFLNIIINAVEAMDENTGHLMIMLIDQKENYEVRIADNGVGISNDSMPKLFEPYFTAKRNGMGLGLPATLNILQAHKAQIDVKSIEGVGTTFSLLFPLN